ncbi:MAG: hypothetical protein S4CHLAM2_10400 [Chlamydiales bacterium]|nr:hypothetical protein [Chlamydiales bacterium]
MACSTCLGFFSEATTDIWYLRSDLPSCGKKVGLMFWSSGVYVAAGAVAGAVEGLIEGQEPLHVLTHVGVGAGLSFVLGWAIDCLTALGVWIRGKCCGEKGKHRFIVAQQLLQEEPDRCKHLVQKCTWKVVSLAGAVIIKRLAQIILTSVADEPFLGEKFHGWEIAVGAGVGAILGALEVGSDKLKYKAFKID